MKIPSTKGTIALFSFEIVLSGIFLSTQTQYTYIYSALKGIVFWPSSSSSYPAGCSVDGDCDSGCCASCICEYIGTFFNK